tara:strand:+ start:1981 stop:3000 length:1020 start_codon:yes stop_codon:yes gene_type:complete
MKNKYTANRFTRALERKISSFLDGKIQNNSKILLACSGGPDSTTLLLIMAQIWPTNKITVAYFDHRLRSKKKTNLEYKFLKDICEHYDIKIIRGHSNKKSKIVSEDALRNARYKWLARSCQDLKIQNIMTGHNQNDQAETVLFRLIRGTSLDGIKAMQVKTSLDSVFINQKKQTKLFLFRPLLNTSREVINSYLNSMNISALYDSTNDNNKYIRNYIRNEVMPTLQKINPKVIDAVSRFATIVNVDNDTLSMYANKHYRKIVVEKKHSVEIDKQAISRLPPSLINRVILDCCQYLEIKINNDHINHIVGFLEKNRAYYSLPNAEARTTKKLITIKRLIK